MDPPFENFVTFGGIFLVRFNVYSIKGAYATRRYFLLPCDGRYRSPYTKSHAVSSQRASGFTNTPAETAIINNHKGNTLLELQSYSTCNFNDNSLYCYKNS